jgi:hypothetical protein
MEANTRNKPLWLTILRWAARVIAILFVTFFLVMFIGEGGIWSQPKDLPLGMRDYALLSLYALFFIGLLIGLRWEGLGGLISLVFMAIHIVILASEGHNIVIFYFFLLPGILYLLSWYFHRKLAQKQ